LTSFFKFEFKDPLQKAEEAEEPKPESKKRTTTVKNCLRDLDPLKLVQGFLRTSIQRSSQQQKLDEEL